MANKVVSTGIRIKVGVNGEEAEPFDFDQLTLTRFLRNEFRLIGTNDGRSHVHCGDSTDVVGI